MTVEILREGIELPAQSNLTWIFKVRLDGRGPIVWKVDSFDLSMWFKDVIGRYPRHERGDKDELEDLKENWDQFEPRLRLEAEREARLGIRIGVDGMRTGTKEWSQAQAIPTSDLPPLSDPQRRAAQKMGIPEEDYARSFVAGEKTANWLLSKTQRLANLLQEYSKPVNSAAKLETIVLRTFEERFDVEFSVEGRVIPIRIRESVVDDLFEAGSAQAEQDLKRILETGLQQQVVQ